MIWECCTLFYMISYRHHDDMFLCVMCYKYKVDFVWYIRNNILNMNSIYFNFENFVTILNMIFMSQKKASKYEEEVDEIVSDNDKRSVEFIFIFSYLQLMDLLFL